MADNKAWSGKTGGTRWMQQSLIGMFAHIDPRWVYPVVAVWVLGYICFVPSGTRGIYRYWRLRGKNPLAAAFHLYITNLRFGMVIMDRFAAYGGRHYDITIEGHETLRSLQAGDRGVLVLSSHVGNQELAGYSIASSKPMYVLFFGGDTATVNTNRDRMFASMGLHLLPIQPDGSHLFAMHDVLDRGDTLSVHADRLFYHQRALTENIIGAPALFPEGPFHLAAMENVPVVTMFMMKEHGRRYTLYVRKLSDGRPDNLSKRDYAQQLLHTFVGEMESVLNRYPHQWFHFYPFWNIDTNTK